MKFHTGVQGSKVTTMNTVYHIDQDPEYPTYPIGWNGFIWAVGGFFNPERWTLNLEPIRLGINVNAGNLLKKRFQNGEIIVIRIPRKP